MKVILQLIKHSINLSRSPYVTSKTSKSLINSQTRYISVLSDTMKAVKQKEYGGPETMYLANDENRPEPKENSVEVQIHGTAVNRADLLMRSGKYPGQKGDPTIMGLEMSGKVSALGSSSSKWQIGDRVMGLLPGGGYAEYCTINEDHLMSVPDGMPLNLAGGIPEAWLTAYQLLHFVGKVKCGDFVLIHGGGSGVGTAAVQLVKLAGGVPVVTAGSKVKIDKAVSLGAVCGFNYKEGEFRQGVMEVTKERGANLILDCVGGSFWKQNLSCLAFEGTWVVYGLLGGGNIDGNVLGPLLGKRGSILTTTLKTRSDSYKKDLIEEFSKNALPYFTKPADVDGQQVKLEVVTDKEFPLESIGEAHKYVADNKNLGKVLLDVKKE